MKRMAHRAKRMAKNPFDSNALCSAPMGEIKLGPQDPNS
jgi:hypothetical protein